MTIDAGDLEAALVQKGFRLERGANDTFFYFYHNGLRTEVHTKISRGRSEDLRHKVAGMVKRQMFLDEPKQLTDFVDCHLTEEDYVTHLTAKGIIAAD